MAAKKGSDFFMVDFIFYSDVYSFIQVTVISVKLKNNQIIKMYTKDKDRM